jgi:hypothetical protein
MDQHDCEAYAVYSQGNHNAKDFICYSHMIIIVIIRMLHAYFGTFPIKSAWVVETSKLLCNWKPCLLWSKCQDTEDLKQKHRVEDGYHPKKANGTQGWCLQL